jgi:hypothetical protein
MLLEGQRFTEKTALKDIGPQGAYFYLKNRLLKDDGLKLLIDPDNSALEVRARVWAWGYVFSKPSGASPLQFAGEVH